MSSFAAQVEFEALFAGSGECLSARVTTNPGIRRANQRAKHEKADLIRTSYDRAAVQWMSCICQNAALDIMMVMSIVLDLLESCARLRSLGEVVAWCWIVHSSLVIAW